MPRCAEGHRDDGDDGVADASVSGAPPHSRGSVVKNSIFVSIKYIYMYIYIYIEIERERERGRERDGEGERERESEREREMDIFQM